MPGLEKSADGARTFLTGRQRPRASVIRRPFFTWFCLACGIVAYGFVLWIPLSRPQEQIAAPLMLAWAPLLFWLLGWNSAIRYTTTHVSVTNVLVITTVAWRDVAEVTCDEGLGIRVRDGSELSSIAFGGSLTGAFTGYPTYRKAYLRLRDAHLEVVRTGIGESSGPQRRFTLEWRRPLAAVAAVYGTVLLAIAASR